MITKDTAKPISTLITVCNLLVDSAETVAENHGDPDIRNRIFDYASKIRNEMKSLEEIKKKIEISPQEPGVKTRLLECAKIIANLTSELVSVNDDVLLRFAYFSF